jgi:hypothetical protein
LWLTLLAKVSTEKELTANTFPVSFAIFHYYDYDTMAVRKEVRLKVLAHKLLMSRVFTPTLMKITILQA